MNRRAKDSGRSRLSRRDLLRLSAAGVMAHSLSGWIETLADDVLSGRSDPFTAADTLIEHL